MKKMQHNLLFTFSLRLINSIYPAPVKTFSILSFDQRIKVLKTAQAIFLAIWAGLNLLSGLLLIFTTTDHHFYFHFHAMNASWGLVNLIVAAFLYYHHNSIFNQPLTLLQQMDLQRHAEKMIMLNIGLDIAFVTAGWACYQFDKITDLSFPGLWKGFGVSILLQGTFLLIQDLLFYYLHHKNYKENYPVWKKKMENL